MCRPSRTVVPLVALVAGLLLAMRSGAVADPAADLARARSLNQQERWSASESLATNALAFLESSSSADSLALAEAEYLRGMARMRRLGYTDSAGVAAANRALGIRERRLGANDLAVAEVHLLVGRSLLGRDRADSAAVHVRRGIAIREAALAPDDTLIARAWDQLAVLERDRRHLDDALAAWDKAIGIRRRAHGPEHPEIARLLAQTGVPWMEKGDLGRARQVLEESLAMFERTGGRDHPGRWIPLNILSDVEGRSGNRARQLDLLLESMRVVRLAFGENARETMTIKGNVANMLAQFEDFAGAKALHESVLDGMIAQYGAGHPRVITVRLFLGYWHAQLGEDEAALRVLDEVDSILTARPGPAFRDHSFAQTLKAKMLVRQGRFAEALAMAERSLATERRTMNPAPQSRVNTQIARMLAAQAAGAAAIEDSALAELVRIDSAYSFTSTSRGPDLLNARAYSAFGRGRRDEAWRLALESERLAHEQLRLNFASLPDRRGLQMAGARESLLDILVQLADGREGREPAIVWDRLVRSRGLLGAELARRRPPAGLAADSVVTAAHGHWIGRQRELARAMVNASGRPDSLARVRLDALRTAADSAEAAYAQALAARGGRREVPTVGLADVRAALANDQALVAFVESERYRAGWWEGDTTVVTAFVARAGRPRVDVVALGRSDALEAAIDPWRARLAVSPAGDRAGTAERASRRLGRDVRARTWDRLAPLLAGAREVFVVGDGPVTDLPWHALPTGSRQYLVETGPRIHVLLAERELVERNRSAPSSTPASLLALGAPDFDQGARPSAPATLVAALVRSAPDPCAVSRFTSFGPLPGAGAEAEQVARIWRASERGEAVVLAGGQATEEAFKREARGRTVLHLATHGVVAADTCRADGPGRRGVGGVAPIATKASVRARPKAEPSAPAAAAPPSPWVARRVWLALAGANRAGEHDVDENEGLLTAEEVVTLDLDGADWVVLSACHSGLAEAWSREGAQGMRRAFALAGARTVIASQWAVDDEATRAWMEKLYAARAAGARTGAEASEAASRGVLAARRRAGLSTHPFYWAAFGASGE
jgi:CHAT domain-containing protein/tetratricopeptide (TPR) repeat protein